MTSTDYYKQKSVYSCTAYFVKNRQKQVRFAV